MSDIQWFPGHMAKTLRKLGERLEIVDVVLEVVDARVPRASTNPALVKLASRRPWVVVATRSDLADPRATAAWLAEETLAFGRLAIDAKRPNELVRVTEMLERALGTKRSGRLLIVGIPNSGKSTLINGLVGRKVARAENRAGVTKQLQWFRISPRLEVTDSPGVLMPKIATRAEQWMLAITGALPRERYDVQEVIERFHQFCKHNQGRRGLPAELAPTLPEFAQRRGFMRKGAELDLDNASLAYIKLLNEGGLGRYSFEAAGLEPVPEEAAGFETVPEDASLLERDAETVNDPAFAAAPTNADLANNAASS